MRKNTRKSCTGESRGVCFCVLCQGLGMSRVFCLFSGRTHLARCIVPAVFDGHNNETIRTIYKVIQKCGQLLWIFAEEAARKLASSSPPFSKKPVILRTRTGKVGIVYSYKCCISGIQSRFKPDHCGQPCLICECKRRRCICWTRKISLHYHIMK